MISTQLSTVPDSSVNVIYADPPWRYQKNVHAGALKRKNGTFLYPTMSVAELSALGPSIQRISATDTALFIWATMPLIQECLDVIKAWGFKYKTCFVNWVKTTKQGDRPAFGVGYYTRSNAELCLVAVRGKIASYKRLLPDEVSRGASKMTSIVHEEDPTVRPNFLSLLNDSPTPVVMTPRREHSRKPEIVREMIVQLLGDVPRIELFAREQTLGWQTVGNETTHFNPIEKQVLLARQKQSRAHPVKKQKIK